MQISPMRTLDNIATEPEQGGCRAAAESARPSLRVEAARPEITWASFVERRRRARLQRSAFRTLLSALT